MAKSALVWSEILTLFVNTLTTDDKYSRRNMLNFTQQFEVPLSQKQKTYSGFSLAFLKCALNLEHFEKKDGYPSLVVPRIIESWKRWLLKRLKGLTSEYHPVINVLTGSKHCWNELGMSINLFSYEF